MDRELFKDSDKEEILKIFDFCSNLVIIDKIKANSLETSESTYYASDYISAYYDLGDFDQETRQRILATYNERNPYYKMLEDKYGIEPGMSREARHLSIIKSNSNSLSRFEEELFYDAYYETLDYFNNVIGTKAFAFHKNYNNFMQLFLIWSSIQKYLTKKMDTFFNIDFYDEKTLKNSFISLGLDYFDGLPINYQRKLLKKINDIISSKGSTQCFIDILEVFGNDTVSIDNYYLVKKYDSIIASDGRETLIPKLEFYKTPFNKTLDVESDEYHSFEEITVPDKYWMATKEEILNKEFNVIRTDYISINSAMNIMENSIKLSYFFNLLSKAYSDNKVPIMNIYNTKISKDPFNLFHAFVALISLALKITGYEDNIIQNIDSSNYVFGYSDINNSVSVKDILSSIKEELDKDNQTDPVDKSVIENFISKFEIKKMDNDLYSLKEFLDLFYSNENIRESLERVINLNTNYNISKLLLKLRDLEMRTTITKNVFKGYKTYSMFLKYNNLQLYNYINIDMETFKSEEDLYLGIKKKMNELITSINSQLYNEKLSESISRNTFIGLNNYIQYYIKTLVLLFKPYNLRLLNPSDFLEINDKNENIRIYDSYETFLIKNEADYIGMIDKLEIINNEGVQIL